MSDYGRPVQFGYFLEPGAAHPSELLHVAGAADRFGLDLLGIQDHPYQPAYLDTWMLLAAIGAGTEQITIFPDVANLPLRTPAVMAKSGASLDLMTGGRFELGLGAGAFWDAIAAMDGPRRTPGQAVAALEEAIDVIRLWWGGHRTVGYDGTYYSLAGSHPGPAPAHDVGIWLGAYGPKMLDLVGAQATGWLPGMAYLSPQKLTDANDRIDRAAAAAGRDPATIRRIYNLFGNYASAQWIDMITGWVLEDGMDGFVFGGSPDQVPRIAEEIAPAVRENVDKERNR